MKTLTIKKTTAVTGPDQGRDEATQTVARAVTAMAETTAVTLAIAD